VIYSQREPALNFDPRVVSRIAELGASLDIDLYVLKNLGSTEEEQETV
jgi:hypothetical protein